jgi:hypothetical protein
VLGNGDKGQDRSLPCPDETWLNKEGERQESKECLLGFTLNIFPYYNKAMEINPNLKT